MLNLAEFIREFIQDLAKQFYDIQLSIPKKHTKF